ncbi:MAG: hypothetical protein JO372_16100 [Solirubrobacterales bacterium]|nr:hypothetical protein [Solirubrobacterales bacterium]
MAASDPIRAQGVPPFHIHREHVFEGFELVERGARSPLLQARCTCGAVLDVAEARFATCTECAGRATGCSRCGGSGQVIDHAALEWRASPGERVQNVP